MPSVPSSTAPLRIRRFRLLWAASVVSNVGSFLQTVSASWLMLQLTGSPTWVGLMVASTTLPLLVFALPAGALADLVDRRKTLIVAQIVMGAAAAGMAALVVADLASPGRLLTLGLLLGSGFAFSLPAWQALVPDLVPRDLVPGAVALNSASFNVARAIGPALGGLLVAGPGAAWAFGLNALSFAGVVAALATLRGGAWHDATESSLLRAISSGLRYARFTPAFRWLLLTAAAFALTSAVLQSALPNFTEDVLAEGAATYGLLLGAMGAGALVGAFSRQRVADRLGGSMVAVSVCCCGGAGVLVGLSRSVPVAFLGMALAGVAWVWTLATLNATTQLLAPAWVRGRIMSLYTLSFVGVLPLGSILGGALADAVGVATAIVALSAATAALGLLITRLPLPVLGQVAVPEPPEDWDPVPHTALVQGGPITVTTTWQIDDRDLDAFLEVLRELRLVRLRTGAFRWSLYRDVDDPYRLTEAFGLRSWDDHLRQHGRVDRKAAQLLREALRYDRGDGPVTRHLAGIDVTAGSRPLGEQLRSVLEHESAHRSHPAGQA